MVDAVHSGRRYGTRLVVTYLVPGEGSSVPGGIQGFAGGLAVIISGIREMIAHN
ncbi:MAG TPA: hypothetical protein VG756_20930 [Pseudonocardiaceae bacterium]|nr:hypothetical protein [Pseudonocardiaceae bacterium]